MKTYRVEFTQIVEHTYEGWIDAESEEEAYNLVDARPFAIDDVYILEEVEADVINILVQEQK